MNIVAVGISSTATSFIFVASAYTAKQDIPNAANPNASSRYEYVGTCGGLSWFVLMQSVYNTVQVGNNQTIASIH